MTDMALLANNLGNTYEGTDLSTNSQSIIKSINELYVNQQILFATSANLFKKINLTLGDLTTDSTLREQYLQLKFANVFDGFVKIEHALDEGLAANYANTVTQIEKIKGMIGNLEDDEELIEVFTSMGWSNVVSAILGVNQRLSDYITNSSSNITAVSISLRDSIASLRAIIGSTEESSKEREQFNQTNFTNILAAIVELTKLVGYNTAAKEEFDQSKFESMLTLLIQTYNDQADLSASTQQNTYDLNDLSQRLKFYSDNLNNVNNTTSTLVNDLEDLKGVVQTKYEYLNTGFENIQSSLKKINDSDENLINMIGSLTEDAEAQNTFNKAGYTSIVDGVCKLTTLTNEMINILGDVENDSELKASWTLTGYDNVISAIAEINTLLGNLSTNNVLKAAFLRLGFSNVCEGLVQFSESLEQNASNITDLQKNLNNHKVNVEAHKDIIPAFLVYQPNKKYKAGERVFVKEFPNYLVLECLSDGTSGNTRPDFATYLASFNAQNH